MSVQIHTLSNGLRVVTETMPGLQSAALGIWVNAGGRHERVEQNGIAHFLEHMAFKGTRRRSALQIAEEIEDVGGYINAYTSREVTAYYARVRRSGNRWTRPTTSSSTGCRRSPILNRRLAAPSWAPPNGCAASTAPTWKALSRSITGRGR